MLEGGRSIGPDAFLSACDTRKAPGVTRALGCGGGSFFFGERGEFACLSSRGPGPGCQRVPHALLRARQFSPGTTNQHTLNRSAKTRQQTFWEETDWGTYMRVWCACRACWPPRALRSAATRRHRLRSSDSHSLDAASEPASSSVSWAYLGPLPCLRTGSGENVGGSKSALLSDVRNLGAARQGRYIPSAAFLLSFFGGGGGLVAFAVLLGRGSMYGEIARSEGSICKT